MYIESAGTGREVVLLHGWAMNAAVWDGVAGALSARRRVHRVDLPGHGRSQASGGFTLDSLACALAERFPGPVDVVGWSLGGMAGLRWAATAPGTVRSLTLVASTPRFVAEPGWAGVDAAVLAQFAQGLAADLEGTLARFLALQARGDDAAKETLRTLKAALFARGRPDPAALASGLAILRDADLRPAVGGLTCPVLVLQGDRDGLTPVATGEWLATHAPGARLECVQGAAHVPFLSHRAVCLAALEGFLP